MNRRDVLAGTAVAGVIACGNNDEVPRILLIGDSTVASYPGTKAPLAGWGQALTEQLKGRFEVINFAVPGNSTRRFADEHWQKVHNKIAFSDNLLIQFGHVDALPDPRRHASPDGLYRTLLTRFVSAAQILGAKPVLVTPISKCIFANGVVVDAHGRYPVVMREVAVLTNAELIDLTHLSTVVMNQVGEARARLWFMVAHDGEDVVHLNAAGAAMFAKIVFSAFDSMLLTRSRSRAANISMRSSG